MAISEAKKKSNFKYNQKCDFIAIKPLKPIGDKIRQAAQESGKSLQGYILDAINKQIKTDECGPEIPEKTIYKSIEWLKQHGHTDGEITDFMNNLK